MGLEGAVLGGEPGSGVGEPFHRGRGKGAHSTRPHSQEGKFKLFSLSQSHGSWVAALLAPGS